MEHRITLWATGSAFTKFLVEMNGGISADGYTITGCFANHCDCDCRRSRSYNDLAKPSHASSTRVSIQCSTPHKAGMTPCTGQILPQRFTDGVSGMGACSSADCVAVM